MPGSYEYDDITVRYKIDGRVISFSIPFSHILQAGFEGMFDWSIPRIVTEGFPA
jgi:hypothetical protein